MAEFRRDYGIPDDVHLTLAKPDIIPWGEAGFVPFTLLSIIETGLRDGFIDATELQRVLCVLGLNEVSELEDCTRMISGFDENGDGAIDFNAKHFLQTLSTKCKPWNNIKPPNTEPVNQQCFNENHIDVQLLSEELNMVMNKLGLPRDINGGCMIGAKEVLALFDEEKPCLEEVKEAFDVFDENRDGFIDATELQRVLCVLGLNEVSELEDCKRMISGFDENGDGVIDFSEFVKFMEMCFLDKPSLKKLEDQSELHSPKKLRSYRFSVLIFICTGDNQCVYRTVSSYVSDSGRYVSGIGRYGREIQSRQYTETSLFLKSEIRLYLPNRESDLSPVFFHKSLVPRRSYVPSFVLLRCRLVILGH
ncbi:hypothetical protein TEA_014562 [Camellia sinensis var. sinensis]|uniref:EF-hand domain-containing protein n=1 Tax=Camellia sinensis var. sinensis TaxID=542762 RepID=A0A4S4E9V3_CAMSN|nr:hypothetical protein TEA_014562 [Camellia sinensis var. sinensis]